MGEFPFPKITSFLRAVSQLAGQHMLLDTPMAELFLDFYSVSPESKVGNLLFVVPKKGYHSGYTGYTKVHGHLTSDNFQAVFIIL